MKHFMMLLILLAAQTIHANENPPAPIPEPSETWEKVQIADGALTWESKSEVAPGRTLYSNIWFVDYFKEAFRIGIDDVDSVFELRMNHWCRDHMHLIPCQKESPYYWPKDRQNNDEKLCKLLGKNSSLDFKVTAINKFDESNFLMHVLINVDLKVYKSIGSHHGLLSVVCAD